MISGILYECKRAHWTTWVSHVGIKLGSCLLSCLIQIHRSIRQRTLQTAPGLSSRPTRLPSTRTLKPGTRTPVTKATQRFRCKYKLQNYKASCVQEKIILLCCKQNRLIPINFVRGPPPMSDPDDSSTRFRT